MTTSWPSCLPSTVGSLPHTDPGQACDLIFRYTPDVPAWPQLPNRDPIERIYLQYLGHFPGAVLSGDELWIDTKDHFNAGLERLYADYLDESASGYQLGAERAAGLAEFQKRLRASKPICAKGQVIGPISAGLQITDQDRRPLLYDEILADALAKYLRLVAVAHERTLAELCDGTIVILDEPLLRAVGQGCFR